MTGRVLYLQYTNPAGYPPLQHSSRILADAGWEVLFLGAEAQGVNKLHFPPHERITVKTMPFCAPGWRQKLHYLRFCLWSLREARRWRPHWVYASEMLSCLPALLLKALLGSGLLYHEHDTPIRPEKMSSFLRLSFWARRVCARRAELCIVPNQQRAERFTASTGARVAVIWNCPARNEVAPTRSAPADGEIKILYQGSVVPDRLPLTVIDALSKTPTASLTVVGYETAGSIGYVSALRARADKLGINGRFHYAGAMSRQDLMALCPTFDLGLSLLPMSAADQNLQAMTGASNKPFDYLANGLPMVVSDLPEWREMFVKPGFALSCDPQQGESIAATIGRFCQDPAVMRAMGEHGRQKILTEWNYERQFEPVLELMSKVVE